MIDEHTKVADLIGRYPVLKDKLVAYNSKFKNLNNPVVFSTVGRFATIGDISKVVGEEVAVLVDFINDEISNLS